MFGNNVAQKAELDKFLGNIWHKSNGELQCKNRLLIAKFGKREFGNLCSNQIKICYYKATASASV